MDIDFALFKQIADNSDDNRNVAARFYDKAIKTQEVTDSGLPIFKNVTYVEIRLKDNNTEVFNQPASAEKIKRFPREYALYKLAKEKVKDGTPLEQFAFLSAAELATCKNRGIFTVEELAKLTADKVQDLGLRNEHDLAVIFVKKAKSNKELADFVNKEEKYKSEIEFLKEENSLLKQQLSKINEAKKSTKRNKSRGEKL